MMPFDQRPACRGEHPVGSGCLVTRVESDGISPELRLIARCTACGALWDSLCPSISGPGDELDVDVGADAVAFDEWRYPPDTPPRDGVYWTWQGGEHPRLAKWMWGRWCGMDDAATTMVQGDVQAWCELPRPDVPGQLRAGDPWEGAE